MKLSRTICCALLALAGCGGTPTEIVHTRESAAAAYAQGTAAYDSRDFTAAADQLSIGVNSGALNPDSYSDAAIKLVVSYGMLGKYNEAMTLLENLERGDPNMDRVLAARAFVLKKQGKVAEANAALAKARQYNRTVKEIQ